MKRLTKRLGPANLLGAALCMAAALASGAPLAAQAARKAEVASIDYLNAPFTLERVLDWGERPVWSPDGTRIAFLPDDKSDGPAYELDLRTRKVRCLTCRWGANGRVARIYYLPDNSFLVLADPQLVTAAVVRSERARRAQGATALFWMDAAASMPPQPLHADAVGEIAINPEMSADGSIQIAWGEFGEKPRMLTGMIVQDRNHAALTDRLIAYAYPPADCESLVTITETYDFADRGKSVLFFTMEKNSLSQGMYMIDLESGRMTRMPTDGSHNETHLFSDERFGLEESNRASDPSSPIRGVTGHMVPAVESILRRAGRPDAKELAERYGGRKFDLFIHEWASGKRRRLTFVSDIGGEAHQSSPARDGRRIAFAMSAPPTGPYAGKGGLYVGTFGGR
jgi:hypothetical protein